MNTTRTVLGVLFVSILLVGAVYAAVSPVLQPISLPKFQIPGLDLEGEKTVDSYSLVQGTNVSETVEYVHLNVTAIFGGINLVFSEDPNLTCSVNFERSINSSQLAAKSVQSSGGQILQVDLYAKSGGLNVTLGNHYQYNGTFDLRIGGVTMRLGPHSNISRFAVSIKYFGGLMLEITDGASFEEINLSVDIGGLQLDMNANSLHTNGRITADINIGGFTMAVGVNTEEVGVSLNATTDIGGLNINHEGFEGEIAKSTCSVRTTGYPSATHKLDVEFTVGLGGGTLQKSLPYEFPRHTISAHQTPTSFDVISSF